MLSLSDSDRSALLRLARRSIEEVVSSERSPEDIPRESIFSERCGVFVSLHVGGRLRGCIGVIEPNEPLGETVVHCALGAAFEDVRFPPLRAEELPDMTVEVSLLTPMQVVRPEEVVVGQHGLFVSRGPRKGLLLPQVATEHHLTRDRFLEEACRKAGLPADSWKDAATEIRAFTCEIATETGKLSPR